MSHPVNQKIIDNLSDDFHALEKNKIIYKNNREATDTIKDMQAKLVNRYKKITHESKQDTTDSQGS